MYEEDSQNWDMMEHASSEWVGWGRDDCVYPVTWYGTTYWEGCIDDSWCATAVDNYEEMTEWEYCEYKEFQSDSWRKDIDEWQWEYNMEQSDNCYWLCETQECNDIYSFTVGKPDHC